MKQMILKIDDDADFSEMPEDLQEMIRLTKITWPQSQLIGTKSYYNKRLILILSPIEKDLIEALFIKFDLNWTILAVEGEAVDQDPLLGFMVDSLVFNEDGDQTGTEEITDLTGKLQTFAGHMWLYE